jgi:hypothetical protein
MAPTARAAFGLPALAATALYVMVFPFGILRTMSRTLSENVFIGRVWYVSQKVSAFFYFRLERARRVGTEDSTGRAGVSFEVRAAVLTLWAASEAPLSRYLAEWDFKWNTRKVKDGERAALIAKGIEGKRPHVPSC